jgi:hypothetical protein
MGKTGISWRTVKTMRLTRSRLGGVRFLCSGDAFYTYQILLDLKVEKSMAVRTEPHPRLLAVAFGAFILAAYQQAGGTWHGPPSIRKSLHPNGSTVAVPSSSAGMDQR